MVDIGSGTRVAEKVVWSSKSNGARGNEGGARHSDGNASIWERPESELPFACFGDGRGDE
jgi:hypothetical protein